MKALPVYIIMYIERNERNEKLVTKVETMHPSVENNRIVLSKIFVQYLTS